VRELKSALGNACMMAEGDLIDVRDLPEQLHAPSPEAPETGGELLSLEAVERRHVERILEGVGGNKARAAKILGINRATVYRILNEPSPGDAGTDE
jgi:transcriptional regulator of acetoin/glycerol metabolism